MPAPMMLPHPNSAWATGAGASPYTPGIMIMPAARTETIRFCKDFWIFIMLILPLLRCYAIRLS